MLPKRLAIIRPEQTMFRLINVLYILSYVNYPFEKITSFSTNIICKIFNVSNKIEETITDKEIKMIITEGKEQGVIDKFEKDILINTLKYNSTTIKNIMIPKEKVDFINAKSDLDTILQNIRKNIYTRLPVYDGTKDNVIGILYVKDIAIDYADDKKVKIEIENYLRPITFIDENEKIMQAFKMMQLNNQQMLIVVNSERKVTGIITMEDIFEVLMGKILDEDDKK
jgi:putative hemolysin